MIEIKFSPELMAKYGNYVIQQKDKWRIPKAIWYKLDWRNDKLRNLHKWFCESLEEIGEDSKFMAKVTFFNTIKDPNLKAVAILRYVKRILTYISDETVWYVKEKWQTPLETWTIRTGDCEDGAILLAAFFSICGISSKQWSVVCGDVKGGGHAYFLFTSNLNAITYVLDWCYWYNSDTIPKRKTFFKDLKYYDVWFGFNNMKSWKKISNPNKKFVR